jgi:hypothetical protein
MRKFIQQFPEAKKRLIYGTDWIMTGIERKFPRDATAVQYPDLVAQFLLDVGLDPEEVMFKNTARFLGLSDPSQVRGTRARLKEFYAEAGIDSSWLNAFN